MTSDLSLPQSDQRVRATAELPQLCHVCGGRTFEHTTVLWPDLIAAWQLSDEEVHYINVQQGTHCQSCGSNVRSIALARAIMRFQGFAGTLTAFVEDRSQHHLRLLEVNEAGTLHPLLRLLPGHELVSYPEVDITSLPFPSNSSSGRYRRIQSSSVFKWSGF